MMTLVGGTIGLLGAIGAGPPPPSSMLFQAPGAAPVVLVASVSTLSALNVVFWRHGFHSGALARRASIRCGAPVRIASAAYRLAPDAVRPQDVARLARRRWRASCSQRRFH